MSAKFPRGGGEQTHSQPSVYTLKGEEAKKIVHSILSYLVSDFTRCAGEVRFDWLETTHLHYPQISSRLAKWRPLFVRRLEIFTGFLILFALLFALIIVERMSQSGVFIKPRYPFMI